MVQFIENINFLFNILFNKFLSNIVHIDAYIYIYGVIKRKNEK